MRCVSQIRADGVAPVPVADACQRSHKDGPKTRRPHQSFGVAGAHQPKNARGLGQSPNLDSRREALGSLSASVDREAGALDTFRIESLDDYSTRQYIEFFTILDRWDREAHGNQTM